MLFSDERAFVGRKEIRVLLKRLRGRLEKINCYFYLPGRIRIL